MRQAGKRLCLVRPRLRLAATDEPDALIGHVRVCGGSGGQPLLLPGSPALYGAGLNSLSSLFSLDHKSLFLAPCKDKVAFLDALLAFRGQDLQMPDRRKKRLPYVFKMSGHFALRDPDRSRVTLRLRQAEPGPITFFALRRVLSYSFQQTVLDFKRITP